MSLKILLALTAFACTSCQSSADKNEHANSLSSDTTKAVKVTTPSHLTDTTNGIFVAKLKDGIEETNAIVNDSTIFRVTKGQLFVYENYSHNAWIADGRSAYIPPEQVVMVDTP